MKITFITTVFNEASTIEVFLYSLFKQSKKPAEIIIVDAGSKDNTLQKVKDFRLKSKNFKGRFVVSIKKGNISVGRNEAIRKATGDIIVCSDAGCVLDKDWLKNIVAPFKKNSVDVAAGYYKGLSKTVFEKCLIPYVLVMPDKVDQENFLPSARSVAFKKLIWKKAGGFPEEFDYSEDYYFAKKLKKINAKIIFVKDAIVFWIPRKNYLESFKMFLNFAIHDVRAGIVRPKVLLVIARYVLYFYFILLAALYRTPASFIILIFSLVSYILWAITKNYRYVKNKKAFIILPLLQFTADAAVLSGSLVGAIKVIKDFKYLSYIKTNKLFIFILLIYVGILVLTIQRGIPNQNRPFPYLMDEWHQLQAVRTTAKFGTPNVAGSANGTMFQFFLSLLYLAPFTLLHIINPVTLKINDFVMRERIFEFLRVNTIIYGILSLFILYKIADLLKVSKTITLILFTFTPIWLMLSGIFKYDIALMFWLLLSILLMLMYYKNPSNINYLLIAVPTALSFSVKISAIPLLPIYIISFFLFNPNWRKNLKNLVLGILIYIFCAGIFGIPDTLFGKGNIVHFFYENVITGPVTTDNFNLGMNPYLFLLFRQFPVMFGHGLIILFFISIIVWIGIIIYLGIKKFFKTYFLESFIFIALLIFIVSLLPLQIYAGGNRSLVLLPFFVLICAFTLKKLMTIPKMKLVSSLVLLIIVVVQIYESFVWVYMKTVRSPQELASSWIVKNIPHHQLIGMENIPIYQSIPDIMLKEFYYQQNKVKANYNYTYQIVNANSKILPKIVVITNEGEAVVLKHSAKKELMHRLELEKYKRIVTFRPDYTFYKMSDFDYSLTSLISLPSTISVYIK